MIVYPFKSNQAFSQSEIHKIDGCSICASRRLLFAFCSPQMLTFCSTSRSGIWLRDREATHRCGSIDHADRPKLMRAADYCLEMQIPAPYAWAHLQRPLEVPAVLRLCNCAAGEPMVRLFWTHMQQMLSAPAFPALSTFSLAPRMALCQPGGKLEGASPHLCFSHFSRGLRAWADLHFGTC